MTLSFMNLPSTAISSGVAPFIVASPSAIILSKSAKAPTEEKMTNVPSGAPATTS